MRMLYLSGAPRVRTLPDSATPGPRAHILGIIGAAERGGWDVVPFVAGDQFQRPISDTRGVGASNGLGRLRLAASDLARYIWGALYSLRAWRQLKEEPDVIYERLGVLQYGARLFRKAGATYLVESNGIFHREAAADRNSLALVRLARHVEATVYRRADRIIAVSETLKEELCQTWPELRGKIVVVPNGVDVSTFRAKTWTVRDQSQLKFVWSGTVVDWQSVPELIHELDSRQWPCEVVLTIIGDGPDMGRVRDAASGTRRIRVRLLGRVSPAEVVAELVSADVALSGHRHLASAPMYHSPLKLYEYLAIGLPVVSTPNSDLSELMSDAGYSSDTQFRWEDGDIWAAVDRAISLRDDPRFASRVTASVGKRHSWDSRWVQIEQFLEGARH